MRQHKPQKVTLPKPQYWFMHTWTYVVWLVCFVEVRHWTVMETQIRKREKGCISLKGFRPKKEGKTGWHSERIYAHGHNWSLVQKALISGEREHIWRESLHMSQTWCQPASSPTGEVLTTINKAGHIKEPCLTQFLWASTAWSGEG
jgi:hypothetical protein